MRKLYLIGIGPGGPQYLTIEAAETIKRVRLFFIFEKASEKNRDLAEMRKQIIERVKLDKDYRIVEVKIPERQKGGRDMDDYKKRVISWRVEKAKILAQVINKEMTDNESACLLIWGEPSLYDGHMEILQYIIENRLADLEFEVIPGISSLQLLTARHRIPLNLAGDTITITTGRRLKEKQPEDIKNTAVLLDNYLTYRKFTETDLYIYWGAYLGTEDEVLISGKLRDVVDEIVRIRSEMRKKKGWIMETYILRLMAEQVKMRNA